MVLHGKSSNIAWRPQRGGMCPVVSAGKKRTVSLKVDAKLYCSILKVSYPKRAMLFGFWYGHERGGGGGGGICLHL